MTTAPVPRLIRGLAVPTIISMLVTSFYVMADTYFVGKINTQSTAAVGISFSIMAIIQAFGFFCGHGSGNFISRRLGARDYRSAEKMAATGFFSAFLIGCAIALVGLLFLDPICRALGSTPTILPYAKTYLGIILLGAPFMASSLVLNNQMRFQGNAVYAMIGLSGALVCILTQQSDDLAADAFNGNMLCLASSVFYAVYLVLSQRILQKVGTMTMLRYTFTGAAFSSLLILPIEGFHAPLFSEPFHWWPFAVLMFVLIFPTVISYLLIPIGLKYLKTTLVAIYGYLILIMATITSLLIGQDRFSWTQTFAIICICAGVYLVEIAEGKEKKTVKV